MTTTHELLRQAREPIIRLSNAGVALPQEIELLATIDAHLSAGEPAAPQAAAQPRWKLVPEVPTEDMLFAAEQSKPRGYRDLYQAMLAATPSKGESTTLAAEDDGVGRQEWIAAAMRVYAVCGDSEQEAKELATYLADQQDWLGEDVGDPFEQALEDIEGRIATPPSPQQDDRKALAEECKQRLDEYVHAYDNPSDQNDVVAPRMREALFAAIDRLAAVPLPAPSSTQAGPALPPERSTTFLDWWHEHGRKLCITPECAEYVFEAGRAAAPAPEAPSGWRLVPVEATEEMLEALVAPLGYLACYPRVHTPAEAYAAMLAAAPSLPAQPKEAEK